MDKTAPSPVNFENNQSKKIETITSELKSVAQNQRIPPQDSDSDGSQPPEKRLLRPRENIRSINQVADDQEEEEEEEEQYCGYSCEKGKEIEKENNPQNETDSDEDSEYDYSGKTLAKIFDSTFGGLSHFKENTSGFSKSTAQTQPVGNNHLGTSYPNPRSPTVLGETLLLPDFYPSDYLANPAWKWDQL
ncbi:hypothetical protein O181_010822 [Austropuccinia psidii MF-1]|uniref:Uncharacterized protein n=1 Tax=Austropuccinia psidii MF-1 TaxID=1389203 RepID=A0A9Q3BUI7_9BASI|nr:hypothetical protein [Austropuccinia psidii MF-1]